MPFGIAAVTVISGKFFKTLCAILIRQSCFAAFAFWHCLALLSLPQTYRNAEPIPWPTATAAAGTTSKL